MPTSRPSSDETERPSPAGDAGLLLRFVRDRDVPCPLCGYNLRALSRAQCPECHQDLTLSVGFRGLRIGWLIATITPSSFSGIAALLLLLPLVIAPLRGAGPPPAPIVALDVFGLLSGLAAVLLFRYRRVFLQQHEAAQRTWAIVAWSLHVGLFLMLLVLALA